MIGTRRSSNDSFLLSLPVVPRVGDRLSMLDVLKSVGRLQHVGVDIVADIDVIDDLVASTSDLELHSMAEK